MSIVLVRIDDRLIHGQVVEGWVPSLSVDHIVVVSDTAAQDPTHIALMEMGLPENVRLEVLSVAQAPKVLKKAAANGTRTMVLLPGPKEAAALVEAGLGVGSVNVGGMHYAAGTYQLGKAVFLKEDEIIAMERIAERGVKLEGRAVPSDSPVDIIGVIRDRE